MIQYNEKEYLPYVNRTHDPLINNRFKPLQSIALPSELKADK